MKSYSEKGTITNNYDAIVKRNLIIIINIYIAPFLEITQSAVK